MIGLGTIINCGSVLAGASAGMLLKNGLSKRFEDTIMQGIGLCTMFIGIGGALSGLLTLENGQLATQHTMLLILSLALGALIGEALNIEKHLEDFGVFCQNRLKSSGDSHFVEGFVSFSLLICIGAMAIVGSVLIFAVSLNMIRKDKIKVGNLLPAVFLPAVFYLLARFFPVLGTL